MVQEKDKGKNKSEVQIKELKEQVLDLQEILSNSEKNEKYLQSKND